jgi:hypothetical protein
VGAALADAFERARWWELPWLHLALSATFLLIFGSSLIFTTWRWLRARRRGEKASGRVRMAIVACSGLNVIFLAGMAIMLLHADHRELMYGLSPSRAALLHLPLAVAAATAVLVALAVAEWFRHRRPGAARWQRLRHALFTLAALTFVPFLAYWNLLRF